MNGLDRREFFGVTAATLASVIGGLGTVLAPIALPIQAVAFDALAVFDPRPVFLLAEEVFPGHGTPLSELWRSRQFEYAWLRALSNNYADFWQVTGEALEFAARALKLPMNGEQRARLMNAYLKLKPWPEVPDVLSELKKKGLKLAFLSNFTPAMLRTAASQSQLKGTFDHLLSTDAVQSYKPDPRAYQLGLDAFRLAREEIAFVAFGGWDAAGARAFGYPTFWVNRMNLPLEELGKVPDGIGSTLKGLTRFLGV